jgi:hypothetical protein
MTDATVPSGSGSTDKAERKDDHAELAPDVVAAGGTALFVRRPVLALVINLLIIVAGLAGIYGAEIRELAGCRPSGHHHHHHILRRLARNRRPRTDRHHRGRGRARLRRFVDLLDVVLRPQPRHGGVLRRHRPFDRRRRYPRLARPCHQFAAG